MAALAARQDAGAHGDLVKYLLMVRKKVKEPKVGGRAPGTQLPVLAPRSLLPLQCSACAISQCLICAPRTC